MKKNSILVISAVAGGIGALIGAGVVLHKKGYLNKLLNKNNKFIAVNESMSSDNPFPTENDVSPNLD